jgi:DNA-binding response OmpR family regulator
VLLARIRAVLRSTQPRASPAAWPQPLAVGDLFIDPIRYTITVTMKPVILSPREFRLLYTLAQEAGRVVSAEELLARVWGPGYESQPQVVYVHIRWLREKLETDPQNPQRIVTVRGVGYKLVPQEE